MRDAIVDAVTAYLNGGGHCDHRGCIVVDEPLPRRFRVRMSPWWSLLSSLGGMDERGCEHARSALRDLQADGYVDRPLLQDWSQEVARDKSDRNLIRLWIAVRVWGGLGRYGIRNVRLGLDDPRLVDSLRNSASAILGTPMDICKTYNDFQVQGTRTAYASKWFWAVSLARDEVDQRLLILDERVRETLRLIAARAGATWAESSDAEGYPGFVALLHDVAPIIAASGHPHVDAEKVEWLLFDRRPRRGRGARQHDWTKEQCLVDWLPSWRRRRA